MNRFGVNALFVLLLAYCAASLLHFVHNAELLADYPGLPSTWTRAGVYGAWLGMTAVGILGAALVGRGYLVAGLIFVAAYAVLGLDSLGHYVLAPMSAHTAGMSATILLEVTAAALVLAESLRLMARRVFSAKWTKRKSP
jgi:hypothetical protein